MLSSLKLRDNYCSDDSNILDELFRPCLGASICYFRSVGYLDSKVLALLAAEYEKFAIQGGFARLLIGRTVTEKDYLAIKNGKVNPQSYIDIPDLVALWEQFDANSIERRGLVVLSWLVAKNILSVKFSLRPNGIHHDKFAYFMDEDNHEVIVHGTNNETQAASLPEFNYESLTVFKSWDKEIFSRLGEYKLKEFLRLWDGRSSVAICVEPPHPILDKIAHLSEEQRHNSEYKDLFDELENSLQVIQDLPQIPMFWGNNRYELMPHQKVAINRFFDSADCGAIFAHATGAGKTVSALHAVTMLSKKLALENDVDVIVIISVPYQVLADQWVEVLAKFGLRAITAYGSISKWIERLQLAVNLASFQPKARVTAIVVVNRTLQSLEFQQQIKNFSPDQMIFIGDECHRLGNIIRRGKAPDANYRIGLSATPWSRNEDDLRETLVNYFGNTTVSYNLAEAFRDNVLVQYDYHVAFVSLSAEESESYEQHTSQVKKLVAIKQSGGIIDDNILQYHLGARAAVLGSADEKFLKLPELLNEVRDEIGSSHLLVYCGSGTSEDDESDEESLRDIERAQLVASRNSIQSGRITANESPAIRRGILNAFESGMLDAVFAIRVLDEGFDMPGIKGAVLLASSRNERQFIQRRGRVLRKSHDKQKAVIWDFVITGEPFLSFDYEKELAEAELNRALEFGRLALNWSDLEATLREYAEVRNLDFDEVLAKVTMNPYENTDL